MVAPSDRDDEAGGGAQAGAPEPSAESPEAPAPAPEAEPTGEGEAPPEEPAAEGTAAGQLKITRASKRETKDDRIGRVAVLDTSYIGDIVFTSVLAHSIRRAWPESQVILVARPGPAKLAKGLGFNAAIEYDKNGAHQGLRGMDKVIGKLQGMNCRALIVPHRSLRSAMFAWRSKLFMRIGFSGDRLGLPLSGALARLAFTHTVGFADQGDTYTGRLLALLQPLGIAPQVNRPRYRPTVESKTYVTDLLADRGVGSNSLVALLPGSEWPTKRWPVEHYSVLADRLLDRGKVPVVLGAEHERPLFEQLRQGMSSGDLLIDGIGTSLDQAAEVLRRSLVAVGGDSGLLHLGLAVGSSVVALFGPTDPAQHDFSGDARVLTVDLPCRPCSAHGHEVCPEQHHRCLRDLDPGQVLRAVLRPG